MGGAVSILHGFDTTLNVYNSIFYNNRHYDQNINLSIYNEGVYTNPEVYIYNSLFEGMEESVSLMDNNAYIEWVSGNISREPMFDSENLEYPFSLRPGSPCIDGGTLNLPEGIELPEYDLAGNPRVVGNSIDMGAYEYQGTAAQEEFNIQNSTFKINIYPNPINMNEINNRACHIWFEIPKAGKAEVAIYNIKGQKVKNIFSGFMSPGEQFIRWNGTDEYNKPVASGNYLLSLKQGSVVRVKKMVVVK